jgi:AraC-like DNA-binding protein
MAPKLDTVSSLAALMRDELARGDAANRLLLQRLCDALLVALARSGSPAPIDLVRPADARMARTLAALHERFAERWTIAKMAKIAGMSRAAFVARFKRVAGAAPASYLARLRVDAARTLLVETDEPAAKIALQVGYRSAFAFSRVFKRLVGSPPVAFRKAMRAAPAIECRATALRLAA